MMKEKQNNENTRKIYDDEFKNDAVWRVIKTGKSASEVARELGIAPTMLARWKRDLLLKNPSANPSQSALLKPQELLNEIQQLRKDFKDMRDQRDILKKALSVLASSRKKGAIL